jgi:hypothetical protein
VDGNNKNQSWRKYFQATYEKRLAFRIYKELSKLTIKKKKPKHPIRKWTKDMEKYFT